EKSFGLMVGMIGSCLALTIGFRQSCWEIRQGTSLYLLHLPIRRRTYYLAKLGTGIGVVLLSMALPILLYASWAASPGSHAAPFDWSFPFPSLRLCLITALFYLGAFASALRRARGIGSRFLPLAAVAIPAIFVFYLSSVIGLPVLALVSAAYVSNILLDAAT